MMAAGDDGMVRLTSAACHLSIEVRQQRMQLGVALGVDGFDASPLILHTPPTLAQPPLQLANLTRCAVRALYCFLVALNLKEEETGAMR